MRLYVGMPGPRSRNGAVHARTNMIILIDNYDSFTFNLAHVLRDRGEEVRTFRCDEITVDEVLAQSPRRIVLSPGPGRPGDRGIGVQLVQAAMGVIPLLGVCLGHQELAVALGGRVISAPALVHGKTSLVLHDGEGVFAGVPNPLHAMRYHMLRRDSP